MASISASTISRYPRRVESPDLISPSATRLTASWAPVRRGSKEARYLGVGPIFGTTSKSDAGPAIGLKSLKRRIEISGLPVIGIGGIDASNAGTVWPLERLGWLS